MLKLLEKDLKILLLSRSVPPSNTGSSITIANLARGFNPSSLTIIGSYELGKRNFRGNDSISYLCYNSIRLNPSVKGERLFFKLQLPLMIIITIFYYFKKKCNIILIVYPDEVFLLVGLICAYLLHCPMFLYFHNTYVENYPHHRFSEWLQKKAFSKMKHLFVINDGLKDFYEKKYQNISVSTLKHTFFKFTDSNEIQVKLNHFAFSGTINSTCLDSLQIAIKSISMIKDATLDIITSTPKNVLKDYCIEGPFIKYYTNLDKGSKFEILKSAHVLILPHSFESDKSRVEIQTIFPTKTIDYLLAQRPILAILPRDCFLADFLLKERCAYCVFEKNIDIIRDALLLLLNDKNLQNNLIINAKNALKQFELNQVVETFKKELIKKLD